MQVGNFCEKLEGDLIHKSNVYFDFFANELIKEELNPTIIKQLRHGDVYIYLDQLLLNEHGRWYKVQVSDIIDIKTITETNQLNIRVGCLDLVLFCQEESQLLAIKNFLELSKSYMSEKRATKVRFRTLAGNKYHPKYEAKIAKYYSRVSN